ncbi:MAG: hypothetical protein H6736_14295 [Alphaproteobacteria bacterium]|nr:hypothetical protein [Alphaproteobacteria bacterium]MCB9692977.1 hypothetical protein [Alphaproteobacteria bacterium]
MRSWVVGVVALLPGVAMAWSPGAVTRITEGSFEDVAWQGDLVVGVGPEGTVFVTGDTRTEVPLPARAVVTLDPRSEGPVTVVTCGDTGVHALSPTPGSEPRALTPAPCLALERMEGTLVALLADGMMAVEVDPPAVRKLADVTHPRALGVGSGRAAAVGDDIALRQDGRVTRYPAPADVVAVAPDPEGWVLAVAGPAPHLALPDGSVIPLPDAPRALAAADLGTGDDAIGTLGDSLLVRTGDTPWAIEPVGEPFVAVSARAGACPEVLAAGPTGLFRIAGDCEPEPEPVVAEADGEAAPDVPTAMELGESWLLLRLDPGQSATIQLSDAEGKAQRFYAYGGPPRLTLSEHGMLRYGATRADIGLWRTAIQLIGENGQRRWTGIVLEVRDDRPAIPVREVADRAVVRPRPPKGPWAVRECFVEAGAIGGASANHRTEWSSVGLPDVVPSASPFVAASCAGGSPKVSWFAGVDSAPAFFYLAPSGRMVHLLGATLGVQTGGGAVRVGPYVNTGLLKLSVGVRAMLLPFETDNGSRHGLFVRADAVPVNLAGSLSLGYAWEFGDL